MRKPVKTTEPELTVAQHLQALANAPGVLNSNGINIWRSEPILTPRGRFRDDQMIVAPGIYCDMRTPLSEGIRAMRTASRRQIAALVAKGEKRLQAAGKAGIGYQVYSTALEDDIWPCRVAVQGPINLAQPFPARHAVPQPRFAPCPLPY